MNTTVAAAATDAASTHKPRVSVIMRAKNSDWVIHQALASLYSQDYTDFELIVVDSGSKDRTLEIVEGYPHRLIRIDPGDYFPGSVLNRAIEEAAHGEILVFQNSDAVPLTPDAMRTLVAAFDDPEVVAAFGRQIPRPEADTWVRRDYAAAFPASGDAPEWQAFSLVFSAMRRTAWEERKFYTEAWGSEDVEWAVRARERGLKVRYVADAVCMHSHNYTLRQLYGRRFIEGEADAFIHRDTDTPARMVRRIIGSVARDIFAHARVRDWQGLFLAPARRAVYQWGYLKGHQHGEARRRQGDTDASVGQKVVLARHESNLKERKA